MQEFGAGRLEGGGDLPRGAARRGPDRLQGEGRGVGPAPPGALGVWARVRLTSSNQKEQGFGEFHGGLI